MSMTDDWYRHEARRLHHSPGRIEVDARAEVSRPAKPETYQGAWVQAWVWTPDPGAAADADARPGGGERGP